MSNSNSITSSYPGFQALPKGVKKMLLVSESLFFEEARADHATEMLTRAQVHGHAHLLPHAHGTAHGQVAVLQSLTAEVQSQVAVTVSV